jgi:hypothetical protein
MCIARDLRVAGDPSIFFLQALSLDLFSGLDFSDQPLTLEREGHGWQRCPVSYRADGKGFCLCGRKLVIYLGGGVVGCCGEYLGCPGGRERGEWWVEKYLGGVMCLDGWVKTSG